MTRRSIFGKLLDIDSHVVHDWLHWVSLQAHYSHAMVTNLPVNICLYSLPQVRVVLLAAAPAEQLFVLSGGADELDRQLLDELGLSGVKEPFPS